VKGEARDASFSEAVEDRLGRFVLSLSLVSIVCAAPAVGMSRLPGAASAGDASAGDAPAVVASDSTARSGFDALSKSYASEEKAWIAARDRAAASKEPQTDLPPHPAIAAWPKFEALADVRSGPALLWLASHVQRAFPTRSLEENRSAALAIHARIVAEHADSPCIRDWARRLSGVYLELPEAEVDALVERFVARSTNKEAVAEALFRAAAQARRSTREGADERAKAWTDRLDKDFADTEYGRKARGEERREIGLGVGKQAPDFTTTDADGKAFRLTDYRGKVVVLDFWGFW
jgi:hypothetical protein